jgi:type I restriction enzyme S subunit
LVDIRATGINPDFLNMVLHTTGVTTVASVNAIGIGSLNLAATDISEVVIPLPPAKEAEEIAERLSNKTAEIDKKISIHEKLINQLNDFKRSLIYEMVSGKKQVF